MKPVRQGELPHGVARFPFWPIPRKAYNHGLCWPIDLFPGFRATRGTDEQESPGNEPQNGDAMPTLRAFSR
jgi:hypothetical protein